MSHTTAQKLAELEAKLARARERRGHQLPRQRMEMLFDPGTFVEIGELAKLPDADESGYGDGVVVGHGLVDGRPVAAFSHDRSVFGGSVGEVFGRKVAAIMEFASKVGCPLVGVNDSAGARIQDAVTSLAWYAEIGRRNKLLSGLAPQVSLILGKCAGGAVYAPANTDVLVGVADQSYMFVTGPYVLKNVTGEEVSATELGGAFNQARWGNLHHVADDEASAFAWVRDYLSYFPSTCYENAPVVESPDDDNVTPDDLALNDFMPNTDTTGYDVKDVIAAIFDSDSFHEVSAVFAPNLVTGYARVNGRSVGVVANQPTYLSGALDIDAAEKGTRLVRTCNAYNIPVVYLVDTPGFMPGLAQERGATIRRSAKLMYAYVEADIPKVTVVLRKAYGGGYAAMGSKQLGADINFAWPTAKIAVMGADSAAAILTRKHTEGQTPERAEEIRQGFVDYYNDVLATPYLAAERGYVDAVIEPAHTRLHLRRALEQLRDKTDPTVPRKHFLMPI